jgi:hypothetical protein
LNATLPGYSHGMMLLPFKNDSRMFHTLATN